MRTSRLFLRTNRIYADKEVSQAVLSRVELDLKRTRRICEDPEVSEPGCPELGKDLSLKQKYKPTPPVLRKSQYARIFVAKITTYALVSRKSQHTRSIVAKKITTLWSRRKKKGTS